MPELLRDVLQIRDRSPWQVIGGYLFLSWITLQVAETLASLAGLPLWFGKGVLVLLGAGMPLVTLTAVLQARRTAGRRRFVPGLTWRRTLQAGLVGFALLGIATAGHLAARSLGIGPLGTLTARGILPSDPELVVARLHDHAHDPELARALTEALRIHLSQSPSVSLVSAARVGEALERMGDDSTAELDLDRAREVAIREGAEGVVGGELHRVGSRYTLSVVLLAATSGSELHAELESVQGEDELIGAVERLSARLRERIGESLGSVRRSPGLSRVRTPSLSALESYTRATEANGRGDFEGCIVHNDQALALDTLFAAAYVGRAACRMNLGRDPAAWTADWTRAYELRARMTERERLRVTALYQQYVAGDRRGALDAWAAYLDRFPGSPAGHFAMANLHAEGREWARAEELLQQGRELDSSSAVVLVNLSGYQTYLGRWDDAEGTLNRLGSLVPGLDLSLWRTLLAFARSDYQGAEEILAQGLVRARGDPGTVATLTTLEGLLHWTLGRRREGERAFRRAQQMDSAAGAMGRYHERGLMLAELRLDAAGDTAGAVALLDTLLAVRSLESLPEAERSHLEFVALLARAGRSPQARRMLDRWTEEVASSEGPARVPPWVKAALAEGAGDLPGAVEAWQAEDRVREDPVAVQLALGRLHDRMGRPDAARRHYEAYLTTPSRLRYETDPAWRGRTLGRLSELLADEGDLDAAARWSRELSTLWSSADPEVLTPPVPGAPEASDPSDPR